MGKNEWRFTYYSRLKNEDCEPIVYEDDRFLVVACADGLGGSGSYRHNLNDKATAKVAYKNSLLKLSNQVNEVPFKVYVENQVCEKLDDVLNCFVDGLFDHYDESKGSLFTSASLASRVVLYSFLIWGLKEGFNSEDMSLLSKTIMSGLNQLVDDLHLSLEDTHLNVMKLVPSTFTAAVIDKENKKLISLNCGDSRNFVLTPTKGLKTLSVDDEDASGSITKLFYIGADKVGRDQVTRTVDDVVNPCIILATSDGFFLLDEFGNLADEYFILSSIKSNNSYQEFEASIKNHIDSIHQDDCSFALASYGYNKEKDIYSSFKARKKIIEKNFKDLNLYYPLLEFFVRGNDGKFRIKSDEEILEDNKIYSRINDLLDFIWPTLLSHDTELKTRYAKGILDAIDLNDDVLGKIDAIIQHHLVNKKTADNYLQFLDSIKPYLDEEKKIAVSKIDENMIRILVPFCESRKKILDDYNKTEKISVFLKHLNENSLSYDEYIKWAELQYPTIEKKREYVISYLKGHPHDKELNSRVSKFAVYRNYLRLIQDKNKVQSIIEFFNTLMV